MGIKDIYEKHGWYVDKNELITELENLIMQMQNEIEELTYNVRDLKEDVIILKRSENLKYDEEKDLFFDEDGNVL